MKLLKKRNIFLCYASALLIDMARRANAGWRYRMVLPGNAAG
jgi:hypothetical protein